MTDNTESKNFKRFDLPELSLAALAFFLVTVLFISRFFYFNFETAANGSNHARSVAWVGSKNVSSSPSVYSSSENERVGFLEAGGDGCDIFDGNWVWDDSYPLYKSRDCPFMDGGFRCTENSRPNDLYTKWRWQPNGCNLPRY
ncbi:Trichome birefringence-like family [Parasponia andersonii]|uniref:Trichome birefringence-like family n=1 Tax=Parasponia andersonii TaxID=3476 RepID=A0A2P5CXP6_PARAD|nr:Trichome birefringence-like family [Parasponia andersonii]